MMKRRIRILGAAVLVVLWTVLTLLAWFSPAKEISVSERRYLNQMPKLTASSLLKGSFMDQFEKYTLDQFPGRDLFRRAKAFVHYNVFRQQDNNGIYLAEGHLAALEYPLEEASLTYALSRLSYVYETYLQPADCKVYTAVIPDKGYYLAAANGYPAMDYDRLMQTVKQTLSFASYVDITDCLSADDYYRTDTHWRQEKLMSVAQRLSIALGVSFPREEWFTPVKAERPFYGVYYGQAALDVAADDLYYLESDVLKDCRVYHYGTEEYTPVYDLNKLSGDDPYELFLSGPQTLLRIENPNAYTKKELIVFRDSFGSSLIPLLVQDYQTVTLVDIRYMDSRRLGDFLTFDGQDVLMLYSTSVLNSGTTLK